jgi:hypothetical protein
MGEPEKPRTSFWRVARRLFRYARIATLLLVLGLVGFALYLNQVGLPEFLRARLIEELRRHGIQLNCDRLRWAFYRGVLATDVSFGPPGAEQGLQAAAQEIAILPDVDGLLHGRLELRQISLQGGVIRYTVPAADGTPLEIVLTNLAAGLDLLPNGSVSLNQFHARIGDIELDVSGTLANAADLGPLLRSTNRMTAARAPGEEPGSPGEMLRDYLDVWRKIQFSRPPALRLQVTADAHAWRRTRGILTVRAPDARTPWGSLTNFQITARLEPARFQTSLPFGWVQLAADTTHTPWATAHEVRLSFECPPGDRATNTVAATAEFSARNADTRWGRATTASGSVQWTQSITNPIPLLAQGDLRLSQAETRWASASRVRLTGKFWQTFADPPPDWGLWTNAAPFGADWHLEAADVAAYEVAAAYVECDGSWHPPEFKLANLHAELYGGTATVGAQCNVASRATQVKVLSDFDALALQPRLGASLSNWLNRIRYEGKPDLFAEVRATLPPWTNPPATLGSDLVPTLVADGSFSTAAGSYLGMAVTAAQGHIIYSNRTLRIPTLHAVRPEGTADLRHEAQDLTGDVYWGIRSSIDPNVARPVLGEGPEQGLDQVAFSTPPQVELQLWLNDRKGGLLGLAGSVSASNAVARGQPTVWLRTAVDFTNQVVRFFQPEVVFSNGAARADGLRLDLEPMRLTLTNAFSDTDPAQILTAIGDAGLVTTLSDYRFDQAPRIRLEGVIPLRGGPGFDLRAHVEGGPFQWWRIKSSQVQGEVRYLGHRLELRQMQGDFFGGTMEFDAAFDLLPGGAHYRFTANATNANLQEVVRELSQSTNHLQGRLDLRLNITNAWTTNLATWNGNGNFALRDGLLWEQPVFSILSGFINAITPGLGSVKFRSGSATVAITNGVFHSKDLLLDSALLQLKARGTVSMEHRVDTLIQARPLQSVGVIGPLLNSILWPVTKALEFRVTGTLQKPSVEPEYVPGKLILAPLRPFETLKSIFGVKKEEPIYQPIEDQPAPAPPQ